MIYGFTFRTSGERSIAASIRASSDSQGGGLLISQPGNTTMVNPAQKDRVYASAEKVCPDYLAPMLFRDIYPM